MQGEKSKSMHSETNSKKFAKGSKEMKAEGHDSKSGTPRKPRRKTGTNAQTKGADTVGTRQPSRRPRRATRTSATAAPPAEKRTQIVSAIRSEKIQETANVNSTSIGTVVPAAVHFHPLPPRIVEIYPEWRGYEVVLVNGRYVIVRPQTHEIVYIIEGDGSVADSPKGDPGVGENGHPFWWRRYPKNWLTNDFVSTRLFTNRIGIWAYFGRP